MKKLMFAISLLCSAAIAQAAVTSETVHGTQNDLMDDPLSVPGWIAPSSSDLIQGQLPSAASGIGSANGFRTDPPMTPAGDQFPAYTDGLGLSGTGLTGLLADNDPVVSGRIVQTVEYALGGARVDEVRVYTGNSNGDARQFSTFVLSMWPTGGSGFVPIGANGGYFQSDATNQAPISGDVSTLQRVFDPNGPLMADVETLRIDFYASGNNNPQRAVDPFSGVNTFTGVDDGQNGANQSPLVWEIDVIGVPEPSSIAMIGLAVVGVGFVSRRRR